MKHQSPHSIEKNQQNAVEVFKHFETFSKKILSQLKTFNDLQGQLDLLLSDSKKSKAAQKKLQELEQSHFFEKNEQLFLVLQNFCNHLSDLSKQMRQLNLPSERNQKLCSAVKRNLSASDQKTFKAVAQRDAVSTKKSVFKKSTGELQKKSPIAARLPRGRKNIIALPGGFL